MRSVSNVASVTGAPESRHTPPCPSVCVIRHNNFTSASIHHSYSTIITDYCVSVYIKCSMLTEVLSRCSVPRAVT